LARPASIQRKTRNSIIYLLKIHVNNLAEGIGRAERGKCFSRPIAYSRLVIRVVEALCELLISRRASEKFREEADNGCSRVACPVRTCGRAFL